MNYYLKFSIRDIFFGVPIEEVAEIARPKSVLRLKKEKSDIAGVFELRHKKCLLFDLPAFLHIESSKRFEAVIAAVNGYQVGFKVDKVHGIVTTHALVPFPDVFRAARYFEGVIQEDQELVQILSFKKILSGTRFRRVQQTIRSLKDS